MAKFAKTVPRIGSTAYLVICHDGTDSGSARELYLAAHLEYVEQHVDEYLLAGPLREPGGEALIGSMLVVAASSADEARAIVGADPYVESGMYARISVSEFVPAAGRLLGGVIWDSPDELAGKSSSTPNVSGSD